MFNISCPLLKPILVLEDDPNVQIRIEKLLYAFGYKKQDVLFAQSIATAKKNAQENIVQLALVDLGLPDGNGIDFIKYLRQKKEKEYIPVMVISAWNTTEMIYQALTAGATGYVLKERDDLEIMFAIRSILTGGAIIDPSIAKEILNKFVGVDVVSQDVSKKSILSNRETEILKLIASGLSSKEISHQLVIAKYTVDVHIKNIYQKLEVNSRTKAIHVAQNIGLLS